MGGRLALAGHQAVRALLLVQPLLQSPHILGELLPLGLQRLVSLTRHLVAVVLVSEPPAVSRPAGTAASRRGGARFELAVRLLQLLAHRLQLLVPHRELQLHVAELFPVSGRLALTLLGVGLKQRKRLVGDAFAPLRRRALGRAARLHTVPAHRPGRILMQLRGRLQLHDRLLVLLLILASERLLALESGAQRIVLVFELVGSLLVGRHQLVLPLQGLIDG